MHTSAVDRATTTTTSINSRTGLEGSRLQAWPGTAKENGQHHHHGHANLRSFLLLHEEGAFSFYDVRHDGEFLHCSLPLAREVVGLASCFSCGVARAEIDDASKNTHVLFTTTQFHRSRPTTQIVSCKPSEILTFHVMVRFALFNYA
jgi:hypothetical protein